MLYSASFQEQEYERAQSQENYRDSTIATEENIKAIQSWQDISASINKIGNYFPSSLVFLKVLPNPSGVQEARTKDTWDILEEFAGSIKGPEDWSAEHDHYLYGTPKLSSSRAATRPRTFEWYL